MNSPHDASNKTLPTLAEQLKQSKGGEGAPFVFDCCEYLMKHGLETDSLFRVCGAYDAIGKIFMDGTCGMSIAEISNEIPVSVHDVAGALKMWFKKYGGSLWSQLLNMYMDELKIDGDKEKVIESTVDILLFMEKPSFDTFKHMILLLHALTRNSARNHMSLEAITISVAPSIFADRFGKKKNFFEFVVDNAPKVIGETESKRPLFF